MADGEKLVAAYRDAGKKLTTLGSGQPLSMRRNLEQLYDKAYQRLVQAGLVPQIRAKYRGGD